MKNFKWSPVLVFLVLLLTTTAVFADITGVMDQDTYVDTSGSTNNNGQPNLFLFASNTGVCLPFTTIYMKRNVTSPGSAGNTVDNATVSMTFATDFVHGGNVTLTLYSMTDDDWTDSTVTASSQSPATSLSGPLSTFIVTGNMNAGESITFLSSAALTAYIQNEMLNVDADNFAAFAVQISACPGPGSTQMRFVREEVGATGPRIAVQNPTAISLSETGTASNNTSILLWGALALVVVTLGGLVVTRKRSVDVSEI